MSSSLPASTSSMAKPRQRRRSRILSLLRVRFLPATNASGSKCSTKRPSCAPVDDDCKKDFQLFLKDYPEYSLTSAIDTLRRDEFARLRETNETYADYMGGSLYPESIVRSHLHLLSHRVLGNTHSISNSSVLSANYANEARQSVMSFFGASPSIYTVVFTANATAALKLVAEGYPFDSQRRLLLGVDSHNSVHGIREFALSKGAQVIYIPCTKHGGLEDPLAEEIISPEITGVEGHQPGLFVLTAQSNISNSKLPFSIAMHASSLGYHTVVDAAALAPTSTINLSETPVDAMAVSFYKMFGYPTGVGALIVKRSFLEHLRRPWFAGGSVDLVQVPGTLVTRAQELHEQFEDGTINYLQLPAISQGLKFLASYLPLLPLRLSALMLYLTSSLSMLRHDTSGGPVVKILSKLPTRRPRSIGEQSDAGFVVSVIFLSPDGEKLPNTFVEYVSTRRNISLRTGCMCNPGGAAALLGMEDEMAMRSPGDTMADLERKLGQEVGVVRISLGLVSDFQDIWRILQFASLLSVERTRRTLWEDWIRIRDNLK